MRLTLAIFLTLIPLSLAHGQSGDDPEQVVTRMIQTGFFEGHDQKVVGRLGDAGAVFATKILAGKDLTPATIGNTLVVIQESFVDLSLVDAPSERQPKTALLVLRYLELSTNDKELKKNIAETGKYIQDRYAATLARMQH